MTAPTNTAYTPNPDATLMGACDAFHRGWDGDASGEPPDIATEVDLDVWDYMGGTLGGSSINVNQSFTTLMIDQVPDTVGRRLTGREITVQVNLAEATLENFARAVNAAVTPGTGETVMEPTYAGIAAFRAPYSSLMLQGFAPASPTLVDPRRRQILRRTLSTAEVATSYTKDGQTVIPATFAAHFVSNTISPLRIIDQTSVA